MATAGLASLYITTECVDQSPPRLEAVPDPGIERGLEWMKANFMRQRRRLRPLRLRTRGPGQRP